MPDFVDDPFSDGPSPPEPVIEPAPETDVEQSPDTDFQQSQVEMSLESSVLSGHLAVVNAPMRSEQARINSLMIAVGMLKTGRVEPGKTHDAIEQITKLIQDDPPEHLKRALVHELIQLGNHWVEKLTTAEADAKRKAKNALSAYQTALKASKLAIHVHQIAEEQLEAAEQAIDDAAAADRPAKRIEMLVAERTLLATELDKRLREEKEEETESDLDEATDELSKLRGETLPNATQFLRNTISALSVLSADGSLENLDKNVRAGAKNAILSLLTGKAYANDSEPSEPTAGGEGDDVDEEQSASSSVLDRGKSAIARFPGIASGVSILNGKTPNLPGGGNVALNVASIPTVLPNGQRAARSDVEADPVKPVSNENLPPATRATGGVRADGGQRVNIVVTPFDRLDD